jgi:hypothetical protein
MFATLLLVAVLFSSPVFAEEQQEDNSDAPVAAPEVINNQSIPDELFLEKERNIITQKVLLSAGYLTRNDHPFGYITRFRENQSTAIAGDTVFINHGADSDVQIGNRFFVYTKGHTVTFPGADEEFGYLISIVGVLEVTEVGNNSSTAIVKHEYDYIPKGASITPEFEVVAPKVDPDKPLENKLIKGEIVVNRFGKDTVSVGDIVYLNVGRSDGVAEADVFEISRTTPKRWWDFYSSTKDEDSELDAKIGKLIVVLARDNTATAVISSTKGEVRVGDKVSYVQVR